MKISHIFVESRSRIRLNWYVYYRHYVYNLDKKKSLSFLSFSLSLNFYPITHFVRWPSMIFFFIFFSLIFYLLIYHIISRHLSLFIKENFSGIFLSIKLYIYVDRFLPYLGARSIEDGDEAIRSIHFQKQCDK